MEKVIHVHLHPARRPAPVRAKTRDCGCQHAKDADYSNMSAQELEHEYYKKFGKAAPHGMTTSGLATALSKAAKAAQDALDQENARELSGLEKHEWNKLSPSKRAEWIQKFAKHKGRTDAKPKDAKRGKDAAFKSPQEALQNVEAAIRGVRSNLRGAPPVYLSDFMQYANQAKSLYKKGDMSGGEAAMLNASKAYQAGIKESRNRDAFTPQQENESRRWRELERQIKNAKAQGKPDLAGRLRKEQQGLERTMTKPESLEMSASR
jgi:hypothetical protein